MREKRLWIVGLALVVAVVAATAGVVWIIGDDDETATVQEGDALPTASSPAGTSLPAPSTPADQAASADELQQFWTIDRLEAALDNPAPQPGTETKDETDSDPSIPGGNVPGAENATAEPTEPATTGPKSASGAQGCAQPPVRPAVSGYAYTRFCYRGRLTGYPARTSGKLIFWSDENNNGTFESDTELYHCTATVGTAQNQSVLMTAGHCVVTPATQSGTGKARWHKFIGFIPSYLVADLYRAFQGTQAEFDNFARTSIWWGLPIAGTDFQSVWSPGGWVDRAYWSHDFGAIVVAPKVVGGSRQTIQRALGSQGWDMTGKLRGGSVRLLGYPVGQPFNGRTLFECRGSSKLVRGQGDPGPELGVGCDMTGGSSGGPWLVKVKRGLGNVVSVNSNGPTDGTPLMYGPRLSSLHIDAFRKAEATRVGS